MAKLKKIGSRFYLLIENDGENHLKKKLKYDHANKAYYTDNIVVAEALKSYSCDNHTQTYLSLLNLNREGSSAQEPIKNFKQYDDVFGFQCRGIQEMILRLDTYKSVLLADEQGLGKTIQTAKVISSVKADIPTAKILIICPASLKLNWAKELSEWCLCKGGLFIQVIKSSKDYISNEADITIVNYDLLTKEHIQSEIRKQNFYMCVCDEAHYLKNKKASRTSSAEKLLHTVGYLIFLTGTPILNRPIELYSLLKCMKMTDILKPYDTYRNYAFRYCNAFDGMWGLDVSGHSNVDELNKRLRSTIMVRREKQEVLKQLPEKSYQIIPLEADSKARIICKKLNNLDIEELKRKPELGSVGEIAEMRQELALTKLGDCINHIKDVLEYKDKIVVFAHHRAIIKELNEKLKEYSPLVFDGSTSQTNKDKYVKLFQDTSSGYKVFIGQIQSAGVGITLTSADTVIFVESSWVPGEVEQAIDRCHRIGQKGNVLAQFLTVSGSIDELMLQSIVKKKNIINKIVK